MTMSHTLGFNVVILLAVGNEAFASILIPIKVAHHTWSKELQPLRCAAYGCSGCPTSDKFNHKTHGGIVPKGGEVAPWDTVLELYSAMKLNLTNHENFYYTIQIELGSPGRVLNVALDTGSPTLVVKQNSNYKPGLSSGARSYENSGTRIPYGKGEASGNVISDKLCVGGVCFQQNFVFGQCSVVPAGADGILGLFPHAHGDSGLLQNTFAQSLAATGTFKRLGIYLSFRSHNDPVGSFVIIGEFPDLEKNYGAGCTRTPFMDYRYMLGSSLDIVVGSKVVMNTNQLVGLDTGSTCVVVPANDHDQLMRSLIPDYASACMPHPDSAVRTICECNTTIGDLVVNFKSSDGQSISIRLPGSDFMKVTGSDEESGQDICLLGIMIGPYEDFWILGDIFFRRADVIFGIDVYEATICQKSTAAVAFASFHKLIVPRSLLSVKAGVLFTFAVIMLTCFAYAASKTKWRQHQLNAVLLDVHEDF